MNMSPEETNTFVNLLVGAISFILGLLTKTKRKKK